MDTIIRNGKIVTAEKTLQADVGIKGGKIVSIGKAIRSEAGRIIDAKGMYVLPGAIDMHVHFNLFFCGTYSEGWQTGTQAAACGGVTTVIDYAIQTKGRSLKEAIETRMQDAAGKAAVDYSLHGGITDWNENTKKEMNYYTANGIPTFKMFMIYRSQGWMADDAILFAALEETKKTGATIMLHAESAFVLDYLVEKYHTPEFMQKYGAYCHSLSRPCYTEYEAVNRAATWAKATGGRVYIVHMSSSEGAEIVARAKKEKVNIWAETCPQYLILTDDVFKKENGHYYGTCPQIKKKHDRDGLMSSVKNGALEVLATDTCTFDTKQKDMWGGDFTKIPFGMPGVETLLPTMHTLLVKKNGMSLSKFISLISANPAKLFGLYPKKGTIAKGSDADIVIFDPKKKVTVDYKNLATKCDWSPYQGMPLTGYPVMTISRGEVIAENGKYTASAGRGRFVPREPFGKI